MTVAAVGPKYHVHSGFATAAGLRAANEDSLVALDARGMFAVCDGIGGPDRGDVGSGLVTECLTEMVADGSAEAAAVEAALAKANRKIIATFLADPTKKGMGSTATVALLAADRLRFWHIGDARLYRQRGAQLELLTEDHNLAWQLLKLKQITMAQYATHPGRNTLMRCLGKEGTPKLDFHEVTLEAGDRLALMSDGVYQPLGDERITALMGDGNDPTAIATALTQAALTAGSTDNVTAVVILVAGGPHDGDLPAGAPAAPSTELPALWHSPDLTTAVATLRQRFRETVHELAVVIRRHGEASQAGSDDATVAVLAEQVAAAPAIAGWTEAGRWMALPLDPAEPAAGILAVVPLAAPGPDVATWQAELRAWGSQLQHVAEVAHLRQIADNAVHLSSLAREMATADSNQAAMRQLLMRCLLATGAERGAILVSGDMRPIVSLDAAGTAATVEVDRPFVKGVMSQRRGSLQVGGTEDTGASVIGFSLITAICAPIVAAGDLMGVVYLSANAVIAQLTLAKLRLVEDLVLQGAPVVQMAEMLAMASDRHRHLADSVHRLAHLSGDADWIDHLQARTLDASLSHALSLGASGILTLDQGPSLSGSIHLVQGRIVSVQASLRGLTGLDALGFLLSWDLPTLTWTAGAAATTPPPAGGGVTMLIQALEQAGPWRQAVRTAPWDAVPVRLDPSKTDSDYRVELAEVIACVDNQRTVRDLLDQTSIPPQEFLVALAHLSDSADIYFERQGGQ
ncbi:MAG: protein phosphatase 2C domain-containing protein [Candidatus Sericytochromatia bacterium]|nr:protein phosphatase 2C domain-containing protein [Candidatus Sericytochromatia bacterium]